MQARPWSRPASTKLRYPGRHGTSCAWELAITGMSRLLWEPAGCYDRRPARDSREPVARSSPRSPFRAAALRAGQAETKGGAPGISAAPPPFASASARGEPSLIAGSLGPHIGVAINRGALTVGQQHRRAAFAAELRPVLDRVDAQRHANRLIARHHRHRRDRGTRITDGDEFPRRTALDAAHELLLVLHRESELRRIPPPLGREVGV